VATANCASQIGTLLVKSDAGQAWHAVKMQDPVFSRDTLMALPGEKARIESSDGALALTLAGSVPAYSTLTLMESALVLHANAAFSLDFDLKAGRVILMNLTEKEVARTQFHFKDNTWSLDLEPGGSQVALEFFSRWPRGKPFNREPDAGDAPVAALALWVLKGQAALALGSEHFTLRAPPGPAYFHWDSVNGVDATPRRRDRLPPWAHADAPSTAAAQKTQKALEKQRQALATKPADTLLVEQLTDNDTSIRELAVYGLGAIDAMPRLVNALADPAHEDVRQAAARALQHYMGRGTTEDMALYHLLIMEKGYSNAHAEIVMQLLHGFSEAERNRPETYETLIAYLRHSKLAVRQLAKDILYAWVPAAKSIAYDPAGPEADWENAFKAWKKLVPSGKLPRRNRS
jgi:hypothetical protein